MTTVTARRPAATASGDGQQPRVRGARTRRVPWVAVGVILVLGGALGAGLLVQSAGDRVAVVVAARHISPGQVIEGADLRVVEVALDGPAEVVPAGRRGELVGQTAASLIPSGSMLSFGQVSADAALAPGTVVVGAMLGPGPLPVPNLRVGDTVRLLEVADPGRSGPSGSPLGVASVFMVTSGTQPGTNFVSLAVEEGLAQRVSDAAAAQRLRLVLLPLGADGGGGTG